MMHVFSAGAIIMILMLVGTCRRSSREPLLCYVGGTMRPAMEELAKAYEQNTGQKVLLDFAESGMLMIKIKQTQQGDIYVAHDPFPEQLSKESLSHENYTVACLTPVIVTAKGNPKKIEGFKDLARAGVRVILMDQTYTTLGQIALRMAGRAGVEKELKSNVVSFVRVGGEAANAVALGTADAAVVWNAVAHLRREKLEVVPIEPAFQLQPSVDAVTSTTFGVIDMGKIKVAVCVLRFSKNLKAATNFAKFCAGAQGAAVWEKFGFSAGKIVPSTKLQGSLFVHCAAGMRKPVEALAMEFEKNTGVKMDFTYDGSNRLFGQIKLTRQGDVYISGEAEYINMAASEGWVTERRILCYFVPVILVKKGNPLGIRTLADLTRPGLRLGQGDPKAAAIGKVMKPLLAINNVDTADWNRNVLLLTSTVNELGAAIKLETLDAAVVWDAIAKDYAAEGDAVKIDKERNVIPVVEAAVLTFAKNRRAAEAFLDLLTGERGRQIFLENKYTVDKP